MSIDDLGPSSLDIQSSRPVDKYELCWAIYGTLEALTPIFLTFLYFRGIKFGVFPWRSSVPPQGSPSSHNGRWMTMCLGCSCNWSNCAALVLMTRGGALIEFIGQSGPPGGGAGVSGVTMVTLMVTQHWRHLPRGHPPTWSALVIYSEDTNWKQLTTRHLTSIMTLLTHSVLTCKTPPGEHYWWLAGYELLKHQWVTHAGDVKLMYAANWY